MRIRVCILLDQLCDRFPPYVHRPASQSLQTCQGSQGVCRQAAQGHQVRGAACALLAWPFVYVGQDACA